MFKVLGRPQFTAPAIALLSVMLQPGAAVGQQPVEGAAVGDAAPEQTPFDVLEFRVLGNTMLPPVEVERAVYPSLGPGKTFANVEEARQRLETAYRQAGFATIFVDIPEQQVDDGVVRLRVTEGKLDRVRVTGARYFANSKIRAALPALTSGQVPRLAEVQEELAALNRSTADRIVTPVLRAGRTPGTVDIELKVEDKLPAHGGLEVSDRYSANTSRLRVNASLSYDNLFQRQHSFSLQYQTAPQERDDVEAFVGSYVFRVPDWERMTFALYAVDSQTDVAALGTLSVLGTGQIFGFRAIRTLPDGNAYSHSMTFGVDYKDFLEDIQLVDSEGLVTPIRYIDWSLSYSGTLRTERATTGFTIGADFGIRGLVNDWREFADKRFKGKPNYMYVQGSARQLRLLPADFQVFGRVGGQYSASPLVSNEQFAIGGADTVRGYYESAQLGDYGFNASLELRNSWLAKPLRLAPGSAYLLAFYDAGVVAVVDPLPSQTSSFDLMSWGLGMRIEDWYGLSLAVDWARALEPAGSVSRGDDRVHFSMRYAF
jgi:hemolysin activation/secretion protein